MAPRRFLSCCGELLGHQDTLDPPVHLLLALAREADALVALQELLDLLCRQPFSVLHAYLHPAAERLPRSFHFHDHPVLETSLIS